MVSGSGRKSQTEMHKRLSMSEKSSIVAVYDTCRAAEGAIGAIHSSGFDMKAVSVLANEHYENEDVVGYYYEGRKMRYWGSMRPFWGGLWNYMSGAGFFAVPGVGPILVALPAAAWLANVLEGALVVSGLSDRPIRSRGLRHCRSGSAGPGLTARYAPHGNQRAFRERRGDDRSLTPSTQGVLCKADIKRIRKLPLRRCSRSRRLCLRHSRSGS